MPGEPDPLYIAARRLLLDALDALEPHRGALILAGAQAVYLHVGDAEFAVAPSTKDGDIAIAPELLGDTPPLEMMLQRAGFTPGRQPGIWERSEGSIDLLVPDIVGGPGRRGARLQGHGSVAARKVRGIEGVLVDHQPMLVGSLEVSDPRRTEINVAGPAALLVAKVFKISDRIGDEARLFDKDALDAHRLLVAVDVEDLLRGFAKMLGDERAASATREGISLIRELFGAPGSHGITMIERSLEVVGGADTQAAAAVALAGDLLSAIKGQLGGLEVPDVPAFD